FRILETLGVMGKMSAVNQLSLSFNGEPVRSPAEWMAACRATIKAARNAGADTSIIERIERQQSQAFQFFKQTFTAGRV
ncbi:MAG: hypothetical protein IE913_11270, partial [Halothiobacillus sp.]|nr:hypothetical protein [Halothiobacillus sp.]